MASLNNKFWQWTTLVSLAFVWGSSFILMKKGLESYSYMQVAAFRIFFAFCLLLPVSIKHLRKINKQNLPHILISGYAGIFFPAFLFTKAQTQISSSLAGMINSMAPLFALIMGTLFYQNRPSKNQYTGIFIGLIGALLLISNGSFSSAFSGMNYYVLYVVIATIGYGINANEIKHKIKGLNGIQVTSLSFLFIGPPAGIYLLFTDFSGVAQTPNYLLNLGYIFLLAAFGSALALFFFNSLIQHTSALFATSVTYIIPFFAILWGIFDREQISIFHLLGIVVILLGVWMVNRKA